MKKKAFFSVLFFILCCSYNKVDASTLSVEKAGLSSQEFSEGSKAFRFLSFLTKKVPASSYACEYFKSRLIRKKPSKYHFNIGAGLYTSTMLLMCQLYLSLFFLDEESFGELSAGWYIRNIFLPYFFQLPFLLLECFYDDLSEIKTELNVRDVFTALFAVGVTASRPTRNLHTQMLSFLILRSQSTPPTNTRNFYAEAFYNILLQNIFLVLAASKSIRVKRVHIVTQLSFTADEFNGRPRQAASRRKKEVPREVALKGKVPLHEIVLPDQAKRCFVIGIGQVDQVQPSTTGGRLIRTTFGRLRERPRLLTSRSPLQPIKQLIYRAEDADKKNDFNQIPLHLACTSIDLDFADELLALARHDRISDIFGQMPLHYAACNEKLLSIFQHYYGNDFKDVVRWENASGWSMLHLASFLGDASAVQFLVSKVSDVNAQIEISKKTALMIAAERGHTEVFKCLLAQSLIDVTLTDTLGGTVLDWVVEYERVDMCEILFNNQSNNINSRNLATNILRAQQNGSSSIFALLCNNRWRQLVQQDSEGNTVLHIAALEGWHEVVESIFNNCDTSQLGLDIRNKNGFTPLECARSRGKISIADLLDPR